MLTLKTAVWTGLVLGLVALAISWLSWSHLPEPMVIHWDARGQPNGWGPRVLGAYLLPALIVLFGLLFALLRRISPQGFRLEGFEDTVALVAIALQGFLLVVHVITLRAARTGGSLEPSVMLLGLGALTAVLGNRIRQLHIHIVARSQDDPGWPAPVWSQDPREPYRREDLRQLAEQIRAAL